MKFNLKRDDFPDDQAIQTLKNQIAAFKQTISDFKVELKAADRNKYRVVGPNREGFVKKVTVAAKLYKDSLPRNFDPDLLVEYISLSREVGEIHASVKHVEEVTNDMDFALRNTIMKMCDLCYAQLSSLHDYDGTGDQLIGEIMDLYKKKRAEDEAEEQIPIDASPPTTIPVDTGTITDDATDDEVV